MQALSTVRVVTVRLAGQPIRRGVTGGYLTLGGALKALKVLDLPPPSPVEREETTL